MSSEGKICMVTGANSGIGKATAMGLAKMGATVVMACRKKEESEAVRVEIQEKSGNDDIDLLIVDLSSQRSVRKLANNFKKKYQQLHVLVNNAGVYFTKRHVTVDGLEMTFAVNYLSRFLLTNLLLDTIKKSAPARVIEVAGAYHTKGAINFDDLQMEQNYDGARANNQSKLANVLFTYELARRLAGTGVTANCLHPGAVATNLLAKDKDLPLRTKFMYKLFKPFFKSPEKGAATTLYLASSPEVRDITGKYFVDKKIRPSSSQSYDVELAKRLWNASLKLAKLE